MISQITQLKNMNSSEYTFDIGAKFLSEREIRIFDEFLQHQNLNANIWGVFESLFNSKVSGSIPLIVRVYKNSSLCGCAIIIKCSKYGRSLFNNRFFSNLMDSFGIPFYLWIKFGCCMDMMSNPSFVRDIEKADEIYSAMADFLKRNSFLTIINDYTSNSYLYPGSSILPALPHALIDVSDFKEIQDYIKQHKNIKRKLNGFRNKGGSFEIISKKLSNEQLNHLQKCFISTSENSVFYLPYQKLYLNSAINTSGTELNEVYYFIAKMNGDFLGYQAAIKSGTNLNALHGAFDRTRKTNFHAYDLLFVQMTEFAIDNRLLLIDFGAVLNITKQRMVNRTIDMSYFLFSKYRIVQWLFNNFLKITKVQGKEQMRYRNRN